MTPPGSPLDTLRRQLEGRWAQVERARERYAELQRRLESPQWKRELRSAPGLLRETREKDGELQQVLAAVEQRARGEQWPATHPGHAVLRELRTWRTKLEALVNKRLARPAPRNASAWTDALETLEAVLERPVPSIPDPTEFILSEGRALSGFTPGHYWVTPRRVVWRPWNDDPEEVKLTPQAPQAFTLAHAGLGLRVEGARWLHLLTGRVARPLVKLLERCRQLPGLRRDGTPLADIVVTPAYGHAASYPDELSGGMAVFWPGFVGFIPARRLTPVDHVLRWFGREIPLPTQQELLWEEALAEHLRRLPAKEFNQTVRELIRTRGGSCWPATEVRRGPDEDGYLRFEHGRQVLQVPPSARLDTLRAFLERHVPNAAFPGVQSSVTNSWGLLGNPLVLALGVGMAYLLFLRTIGGNPEGRSLYFLGHAALGWVFMRYAKARGHHPLLGLVLSFLCTLAGPFLLLVAFKGNKPRRSKRLK